MRSRPTDTSSRVTPSSKKNFKFPHLFYPFLSINQTMNFDGSEISYQIGIFMPQTFWRAIGQSCIFSIQSIRPFSLHFGKTFKPSFLIASNAFFLKGIFSSSIFKNHVSIITLSTACPRLQSKTESKYESSIFSMNPCSFKNKTSLTRASSGFIPWYLRIIFPCQSKRFCDGIELRKVYSKSYFLYEGEKG